MDMTTRMCGGALHIESVVGQGTTVDAVWQAIWTKPPLGNMVSTVKTILVMNPEILFQYAHKVDDRCFSLDSGEIRAALGGRTTDATGIGLA